METTPTTATRTEDGGSPPSHRRKRDYSSYQDDRIRRRKRRRTGGDDETRRWVVSPCELSSYKDRVTVVSYNILGVENVSKHPDLYNQVTAQNLSWDKRKDSIQKELNCYNPSILCLQEVDRFDDLDVLLRKDGYVGVYKHRTGEASDGCAMFWKSEQFTLIHQENIEYQKFGLRDNVAQLCLFKVHSNHSNVSTSNPNSQSSDRTLLVGNIHVLFNPNRGDIKLGQIRILLDRANIISEKWGNSAIVISGDLNSTPQSAVYQFLSSPKLDILSYDRKKISGQTECSSRQIHLNARRDASICTSHLIKYRWSQEEMCLATGSTGCSSLRNPLRLSSAYTGVPVKCDTRDYNGEPLVTSFHSKFMGTVDYIWHSASLVPVRVVETLPVNILERLQGLPSKNWGSDHLALVCELAFVDDDAKTHDS